RAGAGADVCDGASVAATAGASGSVRRMVKSPMPAMTAAATTTAVSASWRRLCILEPPWSSRRNHGKVYSDIRSHPFHTAIVIAPKVARRTLNHSRVGGWDGRARAEDVAR